MEIGRSVFVAEIAVEGIRFQPMVVGGKEPLEFAAVQTLLAQFCVQMIQIVILKSAYTLIIYCRKGI